MTQNLSSVNCPKCGAPLEYPNDAQEITCPFCGSVVTKDNITIVNASEKGKVIDIGVANIDQLHELEQKIGLAKKFQIKVAGQKLLMNTLGPQYEEFMIKKKIDIQGSNGKIYTIHTNGYLEVFELSKEDNEKKNIKKGDKVKISDGQLFRQGYPASDAVVTFYTYAKFNADKLDNLWGCGNIKLTGGELREI